LKLGTSTVTADSTLREWDPADTWATLNERLTLQRRLDRLALV
jgi:hypothetical protein